MYDDRRVRIDFYVNRFCYIREHRVMQTRDLQSMLDLLHVLLRFVTMHACIFARECIS